MTSTTFPLHGYERFFAMSSTTSAKIAHVMTIRGDITTLLTHLPTAVLTTFNTHPKMRTMLLPNVSPQQAIISPPLVDATELMGKNNLFSISWREEEETSIEWKQYVQEECQQPLDRTQTLPYYLRVFADQTTKQFARIILFSDHYMSDTTSGGIILNDILEFAVQTSQERVVATTTTIPTTLRPSLYECQHVVHPFLGIFHEAVSKWIIEPLFHFDHSGFVPYLAVDGESQQDYRGKPPIDPINPSTALFDTGTVSNTNQVLAKCKEEGVTLQSALTAATILACGLAKTHGRLSTSEQERINVKTDALVDMRHVLSTVGSEEKEAVGLYSTAGNLVFTSSEGISIHHRFWDVARRAEGEIRTMLDSHELKMQSMFVHETLNAESVEETLTVQNSVLSDTTIANVGVYPYPPTLEMSSKSGIHIESLHVYNALPSLSSASMVFLSGVTSFNYSMMSKLEPMVAKELFYWYVQCVENMGAIHTNDTMIQASKKLEGYSNSSGDVEVVPRTMATEPM